VKLLFDENLSPRLVDSLSDLYPDSLHVHECGLGGAKDEAIWEYAKNHSLTIVSKDSDFEERSLFLGAPPKFVWIHTRNCTTLQVEKLLRAAFTTVKRFIDEGNEGCVVLGRHRLPT
jgi:predicted nuclease of predicted toxin-antitoxin system